MTEIANNMKEYGTKLGIQATITFSGRITLLFRMLAGIDNPKVLFDRGVKVQYYIRYNPHYFFFYLIANKLCLEISVSQRHNLAVCRLDNTYIPICTLYCYLSFTCDKFSKMQIRNCGRRKSSQKLIVIHIKKMRHTSFRVLSTFCISLNTD
jgi:hypothetical protein